MKRKINMGLLLLSLTMIFLGYRSMREALLISRGNRLSLTERYIEGDKVFEEASLRYSSKIAQRNRGVNLYNGEEYSKLIESDTGKGFLRGNAHTYLGEQDPTKARELYEAALTEYREAMKVSGDINIKKNYEIVSRRLEDMKNREEKQQENKQDQKQDKDQQDQNNRDNDQKQQGDSSHDQQGYDKQDTSQGDKDQKQKSENQKKDQIGQDNKKDSSEGATKPESNQSKDQAQRGEAPEETTQRREALTILERLEGSEEQAFKNNERLKGIGGEDTHEGW